MKLFKILNSNLKNISEVKHEEILESKTDASEWKLEVERVLPQLKVTIKTDHKVYLIYLIKSPKLMIYF